MQCHDRVFKSVTILSSAGDTIYTVSSKGAASFSWRRTVVDSTGEQVFDLRHLGYAMKNKWVVEDPKGREICTLHHVNAKDEKSSQNKERSDLDMIVKGEEGDVKVEMRQVDRAGNMTLLYVGDETVAEIRVVEENDVVDLKGKNRSVWEANVAGGMDLALVSTGVPTDDGVC
jgi:LURP-one-related